MQTQVFGPISAQIEGGIQCSNVDSYIGPFGVSADILPHLDSLTATTYLTHQDYENDLETTVTTPNPWQGVVGGIMITGEITAHANVYFNDIGLDLEDCTTRFTYDERYTIGDDGIFTLIPLRVQLSSSSGSLCNGAGILVPYHDSVQGKLEEMFEQKLPQQAHDLAAYGPTPGTGQYVTQGLPTATDPVGTTQWHCAYPPAPNTGLVSLGGSNVGGCADAADALNLAVAVGGGKLGITDFAGLDNTIRADSNWICTPPTQDQIRAECAHKTPLRGNCTFVVSAQRAIAEPNEIRIAWPPLDIGNSTIPAAPSTAAFVASFYKDNTSYLSLCAPATTVTASHPYYQRYFATFNAAPTSCQWPSPGPGPHPLSCGCTNASDCFNGDQCLKGQCRFVCLTDYDCYARGMPGASCKYLPGNTYGGCFP